MKGIRKERKRAKNWNRAEVAGLAASLGLMAGFVNVTRLATANELGALDKRFNNWVKETGKEGADVIGRKPLDGYFDFFKTAGKQPVTLVLASVCVLLLVRRKQYTAAWLVAGSVLGGFVLNRVLKLFLKRPRPVNLENNLLKRTKTSSYPSGHTALAVCFYGVLGWLGVRYLENPLSRTAWIFFLLYWVGMIGLSRVYTERHWPTDVLGGVLEGSSIVVLLTTAASRYERIRQLNPGQSAPDVTKKGSAA